MLGAGNAYASHSSPPAATFLFSRRSVLDLGPEADPFRLQQCKDGGRAQRAPLVMEIPEFLTTACTQGARGCKQGPADEGRIVRRQPLALGSEAFGVQATESGCCWPYGSALPYANNVFAALH